MTFLTTRSTVNYDNFVFSARIRNAHIWYDIEQLQWKALTIQSWKFHDERWKNDNRILQRKWNSLWRYCGTFHVRLCHWSVTFYVLSYPILSRSLIARENSLNAVLAYALYVRGKFTRRQSVPPPDSFSRVLHQRNYLGPPSGNYAMCVFFS